MQQGRIGTQARRATHPTAGGAVAAGLWLSIAVILVQLLAAAHPVRAESPPQPQRAVLVELYTSHGCAACPPADALLAELADRSDIVALAMHVDYWDYIGWSDPFARPEHTARQKAYARAAGARSIYTPQMVIDGAAALPGNRRAQVLAAIEAAQAQPPSVRMTMLPAGPDGAHQLALEAVAGPFDAPALVQLVRYLPAASVRIVAGENRGRVTDDRNVVTGWSVLAEWNGAAPMTLTLPPASEGPLALIVQAAGPGQVLAAASIRGR